MAETANRVMVPGYRHVPGNHCGSTALRNLLAFHGVEISEEMAFGLGAGACFYYVVLDEHSPTRFTNGRAARLEENFLELTEVPLRLRTDADPEASWRLAREDVDAGRPVLLLTDLYYLDHYGRSAHFPGHAVVLAGYDEELAWLSDTAFEDLQTTSLESLERGPALTAADLPAGGARDRPARGRRAESRRAARPRRRRRSSGRRARCSSRRSAISRGCPALRRFAAEVGDWPEAAEDWQWCARFLYQVIERRGTGGGNFRTMYSRFLEEAGYEEAALAHEAAERLDRPRARRARRRASRSSRIRSTGGQLAAEAERGARRRGAALGRWPRGRAR